MLKAPAEAAKQGQVSRSRTPTPSQRARASRLLLTKENALMLM